MPFIDDMHSHHLTLLNALDGREEVDITFPVGRDKTRTMKGEASVMAEVAAAITTIGVLLCVAIGAVAMAAGVMPKPASATTLSCTTSSCARRRAPSVAATRRKSQSFPSRRNSQR